MQILLMHERKKNKLTQNDLAKLLGLSAKQYGAKERSEVDFTASEMFILSDYFKMEINQIFLPRK